MDRHVGPMRILGSCAGEGRDMFGVLSERDNAQRLTATLVELHPDIAERARAAASAFPATHVEVRIVNAGNTDAYVGAVPADLVLRVGIFRNISDVDLWRTIAATP